jgi:hypothetical protein
VTSLSHHSAASRSVQQLVKVDATGSCSSRVLTCNNQLQLSTGICLMQVITLFSG